MSARFIAAGRLPRREVTPIASAERLARFVRDTFSGDLTAIARELRTWRDRESLPLSDGLLDNIAAHVVAERTREAAA